MLDSFHVILFFSFSFFGSISNVPTLFSNFNAVQVPVLTPWMFRISHIHASYISHLVMHVKLNLVNAHLFQLFEVV